MDCPKPVSIETPPPSDEAAFLVYYLEGIPLVQIARALNVGIGPVLDFLRSEEVRECIWQYEESLVQQTRLSALAARIPAMTTLREVCATEGSIAERRRAASELLRQSRAAEKPAKGQRFGRTAHSTPNPEKFMPNPNVESTPEIPRHVRPLEPYEMTLDLPRQAPAASQPSAPIATESPSDLFNDQHSSPPSDSAQATIKDPVPEDPASSPLQGSFIAHDHTASWHAFERKELDSSASNLDTDPISETVASQDQLCSPEISTPLPDAVPVAA